MHTTTESQPIGDPFLTLDEGAAFTKFHETTLRREIKRGRLRAARVGGRGCIRFRQSWLADWLERQATPIEA